ncbi:E3 ubiquitin-protein ligase rad18 [Teratosphaeriaceae sp. CCFEE 6253]|nr:E3 ubiquitin-protein ligase rad18 [Teratosphaeriaceae sp. CCFEE 6253]
MDTAPDIPDSTDWLDTPLKDFAQLENALHCQICKEFYDTPMITSCAHTFCSRCIRTSLSADGKCPACRTADQASKLRNNWALQEVVATFVAARPAAIGVARREQELVAQQRRPGKRKRAAVLDSADMEQSEGRTTRSKSRKTATSQPSHADAIEIVDSEDEDEEYQPGDAPDDGLVECPLGCGKRMKIEQVDPHLDRCADEQEQDKRAKSRPPADRLGNSRADSRPKERLAELNYSLLKDITLRRKLEELGIPGWGSKPLMIRRHTEWVNVVNANADSDAPRSNRRLLQDLETWERTQGGKAPAAHGNGVMRKDFDGEGWTSRHRDDFSRLVADARRKTGGLPQADGASEDSAEAARDGGEGRSPHFTFTAPSEPPLQRVSPPPPPPPPQQQPASTEAAAPYADRPDALASIREKVAAANAGEPIEPVMNDGFVSQHPPSPPPARPHLPSNSTSNSNSHSPPDPTLLAPPGTENPALLAQGHFGHEDPEQRRRYSGPHELGSTGGSRDEHSPGGRSGTPLCRRGR